MDPKRGSGRELEMAITLLELKGDEQREVADAYLDVSNYEDDVLVLKQYGPGSDGDWVALTKPMLLELYAWIGKELR